MNREEFFQEFERVLVMGLHSGALNVPLAGNSPETAFRDKTHWRKFLQSCHRGYEKAQSRVVELIGRIETDSAIAVEERAEQELLLRKIIDGIAVALFMGKSHMLRRLVFHRRPPKVSVTTLKETLEAATRLNSQSRLTFALVADLTTFIHVCDIVRIDFREDERRVSLIELKSGRVNEMLMSHLERYEPTEEAIAQIANDPLIPAPGHRSQAQRMLRQKMRLAQVQEVISTDSGTDIKTKRPIKLSQDEVTGTVYDKFLNDLLDQAHNNGASAGVVNYCVHIGVGYSDDPESASRRASKAVDFAVKTHLSKPPDGFLSVLAETTNLIPDDELVKGSELLASNLAAMSRPFTHWGISKENLMDFAKGKLIVFSAFDVSSFIWLARDCGLDMRFSSRAEAARLTQDIGSAEIATWGNRALCWGVRDSMSFVGSGLISRFINDLTNPLPFLQFDAQETLKTTNGGMEKKGRRGQS